MSKYIIEIKPEYEDKFKGVMILCAENSNLYVDSNTVDELEELTADYINEHFGSLQDDAYKRGLEDGKAVNDKGCEGCLLQGTGSNICDQCCNSYANQWMARDGKIEVGDEVEPFYTDITGVVTLIDGDTIYILWRDGSSTSAMKLKEVTKTGRHFDIASILEAMKHD